MAATLPSFPEELLERILAHAVIAPAAPHPRASWHSPSSSSPSSEQTQTTKPPRGRTAPLLVSHTFHRIALPLFYHTLVLHSPRQSAGLLAALRARPFLASAVRVLVLASPSAGDAEVLGVLMLSGESRVGVLDVTLPSSGIGGNGSGGLEGKELEELAGALRELCTLRALSVRKGAGTYLSQRAPRVLLDALAEAVNNCAQLHTTTLTFPLSTDPALLPLANALSTAPALTTLRTPLPALPNAAPAYALVAENESLQRVCLGDDIDVPALALPAPAPALVEEECANAKELLPVPSRSPRRATCSSGSVVPSSSPSSPRAARPILPTSLFLSAARPHDRLCELIRAGTHVAVGGWRGRAVTIGGC
ncbi:hypothetical protein R3P38DRAFT_2502609 [Favolaschia claudopus]|uniref:F-box domain-containing protein n=1 Tax=Favolaschia claudopus TaxID=2862362 RepID=A0AAW0DLQ4_9AGAR